MLRGLTLLRQHHYLRAPEAESKPVNRAPTLVLQKIIVALARTALLLAGLAASGVSHARDPIELKSVPLDIFMQKKTMSAIPFSVPVPAQYEFAKLKGMRWDEVSWMKPEDVENTNKSGDLPVKNGFMLGKIPNNVQYDKASDVFVGVEDAESMEPVKRVTSDLKIERLEAGGHRVLLISMTESKSGKHVYTMYIATGLDTATVRISFRPPDNDQLVGDFVWAETRRALSAKK